jgi:hypothetical protein
VSDEPAVPDDGGDPACWAHLFEEDADEPTDGATGADGAQDAEQAGA